MEQNIINVVRQKNSLLPMNKTDYENFVQPRLNNILKQLELLNINDLNPIRELTNELLFKDLEKSELLDLDTTLIVVLKNGSNNLLNVVPKIDEYKNITNILIISHTASYNNLQLPENCNIYVRTNITDNTIYNIITSEVKTNYFFYLDSDFEIVNYNTNMLSKCKKILSTHKNVKQMLITQDKKDIFVPGMYSIELFRKNKCLDEYVSYLSSNKLDMAYLDEKIVTKI